MAAIKFCGLTRSDDARAAALLGASWLGVIFAGGPRRLTAEGAVEVFRGVQGGAVRVGVFGADSAEAIAATAELVALDVVQLHADPTPAEVEALRGRYPGEIWAVVRPESGVLPDGTHALARSADALLLDARVPGQLGGAGLTLDWAALASQVDGVRGDTPLVLAGGLTPSNVGEAIRLLAPDAVDVSSGVECRPGVKDHERMRAFAEAVRSAPDGSREAR